MYKELTGDVILDISATTWRSIDRCSHHLTGEKIRNNYIFCAIYSVNITLRQVAASKTVKVMYSPSSDYFLFWWGEGRSMAAWGERAVSVNTAALFMFKICFLHVSVKVSAEGVEFKCDGTKLIFWQWHQRRWLLLCLKWSMFEVFRRQWSGRASSLLPRSGDDYQLLSARISETTVSMTCE